MKRLRIERSRITPEVSYDSKTKTLEIVGRSYPENPEEFYEPLIEWIEDMGKRTHGMLKVAINLEYLNTSSTKTLINALYRMEQICLLQQNQLLINWYYKPEDEDIMETGEIITKILKTPVRLIESVV